MSASLVYHKGRKEPHTTPLPFTDCHIISQSAATPFEVTLEVTTNILGQLDEREKARCSCNFRDASDVPLI